MLVTVGNYHELSGTITLEGSTPLEGTIITVAENGACDTTDETGYYHIPNVWPDDQLITVERAGFGTFDTTIFMDQDYELNATLALDFICGDANLSGGVNLLDISFLISYLYKQGAPPDPVEAGDVNNNGSIDILDISYLINYLYKSGPAPVCQ